MEREHGRQRTAEAAMKIAEESYQAGLAAGLKLSQF